MNLIDSYISTLYVANAEPDNKLAMTELQKRKLKPNVEQNFNLEEYINSLGKPVIEIGGPTPKCFHLVDAQKLKLFFTSNLASPGQKAVENGEVEGWKKHVGSSGEIKFQADGQSLPIADESVGAVLISAMVNDLELNKNIIDEAKRVLVTGGILLLEANNPNDVLYALNSNFSVMKWKRELQNILNPYFNIALKKD